MMNRAYTIAFRSLTASLFLCTCFVASALAQAAPSPTPRPMPPGMKGADVNDPRAKLTPGMYDAGEAAIGMKHITLLKKPDAFQLGTTDANSPRVKKTLSTFGIPENAQIPPQDALSFAALAFANSDMAFQGNRL